MRVEIFNSLSATTKEVASIFTVDRKTIAMLVKGIDPPYGPGHPLFLFKGRPLSQVVREFVETDIRHKYSFDGDLDVEKLKNSTTKFISILKHTIDDKNRVDETRFRTDESGGWPGVGLSVVEIDNENESLEVLTIGDVFTAVQHIDDYWFAPDDGALHEALLDNEILRLQNVIASEMKYGEFSSITEKDVLKSINAEMWKRFYDINIHRKNLDVNNKNLPTGYGLLGINTDDFFITYKIFDLECVEKLIVLNSGILPQYDPKSVFKNLTIEVDLWKEKITGLDVDDAKASLEEVQRTLLAEALSAPTLSDIYKRALEYKGMPGYGNIPCAAGIMISK